MSQTWNLRFLNAGSINKRIAEMNEIIEKMKVDLICLVGTNLQKGKVRIIKNKNYHVIPQHRFYYDKELQQLYNTSQGSLIFIKKGVDFRRYYVPYPKVKLFDYYIIRLKEKKKITIVASFYITPTAYKFKGKRLRREFKKVITKCQELKRKYSARLVVMGDLNLHSVKWEVKNKEVKEAGRNAWSRCPSPVSLCLPEKKY